MRLWLLLPISILADISFPTFVNSSYQTYQFAPAYPLLLWNRKINAINLTVVDLQKDVTLFDWCDIRNYNKAGVLPLLNSYNITQKDLDAGEQWITFYGTQAYAYDPFPCQSWVDGSMTFFNAYVMSWDDTISYYIQQTGASGWMEGWHCPTVFSYYSLEYADKSTGVVLGSKINIFAVASPGPYMHKIRAAMSSFLEVGQKFIITVSDTFDPNSVFIDSSVGAFYYVYRAFTSLCFLFTIACTFDLIRVSMIYIKAKGLTLSFISANLIFCFFGNICRMVVFADPMGIYRTGLGFVTWSLFNSASDSFHVFASMSSLVIWMDTILSVQAMLNLKFRTASLSKNVFVQLLFFIGSIMMAAIDIWATYFGYVLAYDPLLRWVNTPMFADTHAQGISQDSFWKVLRLFLFALLEIFLAFNINYEVRGLLSHVDKSSNTISPAPLSTVQSVPSVTIKGITKGEEFLNKKVHTTSGGGVATSSNSNLNTAKKLSLMSFYMIVSGWYNFIGSR